jgi:hypothetical protein
MASAAHIWHAACVVSIEAKAGLVSPADNGARIPIECVLNSEWLRASQFQFPPQP